jgi:hypothetical protein
MTLWMAATLSSSTAALAFNRKPYSDYFGQPFCQPAGSATGWGSLQLMHHAKPMQISGGSIVPGSVRRPSLEGPSSIRIKLLRWIKAKLAKANLG